MGQVDRAHIDARKTTPLLEVAKRLPTSSLPRLPCPYTRSDTHIDRTIQEETGTCDNGFWDSCPCGINRHLRIANAQVRGNFRGGRGTRTHKPLRTTVFKLSAHHPESFQTSLTSPICAGRIGALLPDWAWFVMAPVISS